MKKNQYHYLRDGETVNTIFRYKYVIVHRDEYDDIDYLSEYKSNLKLNRKKVFKVSKHKKENFLNKIDLDQIGME